MGYNMYKPPQFLFNALLSTRRLDAAHLVMGPNDSRGQWRGTDLALGREDNIIVGSHNGTGKLAENDGLLGHWHVLFLAVVHVIHAHAHHLVWPCDWSQEGHL